MKARTWLSRGAATYDNRDNLAPGFFDSVVSQYENAREGRQELNAEVLDDIDGALWTHTMIDSARLPAGTKQDYSRIVIAVDPATPGGHGFSSVPMFA